MQKNIRRIYALVRFQIFRSTKSTFWKYIYTYTSVRSTLASRNDKFTKQYNVEKFIEPWNHSIYIRFVVLPSSWIFISRRPFSFVGLTPLLPGQFTRLTLMRKPFKFLSGNEPSFICRTYRFNCVKNSEKLNQTHFCDSLLMTMFGFIVQ